MNGSIVPHRLLGRVRTGGGGHLGRRWHSSLKRAAYLQAVV
jgi:hypothetical protein